MRISDWSSDVCSSDLGDALHAFPAITASVCNLRPTSRGHVRIVSPKAADAPAILCNYLQTDQDRRVAADSMRLTRTIMAQPALASYKPEEYKPGSQVESTGELERAAGEIGTNTLHPVGTQTEKPSEAKGGGRTGNNR